MTNNSYEQAKQIASGFFFIKKNIKTPKSFRPHYIFYRIFRPILKLYYKLYLGLNSNSPWTSPASVEIFKSILKPNMHGLEYGSGKSTIFFAQRLSTLISVEHHPTWYEKVKSLLKKYNLENVVYHHIPKENENVVHANTVNDFYKEHQITIKKINLKADFKEYFQFPKNFPNNNFDFILVDGRARVECAYNSIPKLKKGGIFVLDNSERERYTLIHERLKEWPSIHTTTGLTDTTLWFKP